LNGPDRRALAEALSRSANATVAEILSRWEEQPMQGIARRVDTTGAPGTGKSSLFSHLIRRRLNRSARLGLLAIDPTSPFSRGAILGDRVRMDAVVQNERLFIRSFASRHAHDGLTDNIVDLPTIMDAHGFDEVILEAVGVGQSEYAVRTLVAGLRDKRKDDRIGASRFSACRSFTMLCLLLVPGRATPYWPTLRDGSRRAGPRPISPSLG